MVIIMKNQKIVFTAPGRAELRDCEVRLPADNEVLVRTEYSTILENSTFTLGMIPFPKYDENQDDYYTAAQRFAHIYIPATTEDSGRSGAVLEAWASECYRNVMPTYFETNLKTRYATDSDMAEMFDLLRANLCVEFGTVFYSQLGLNCDTFKNLSNSSWNFASETEKLRTSTEAQLEVLIAALNSWQND